MTNSVTLDTTRCLFPIIEKRIWEWNSESTEDKIFLWGELNEFINNEFYDLPKFAELLMEGELEEVTEIELEEEFSLLWIIIKTL